MLLLKQHRRGGRIALSFATSYPSSERAFGKVQVKGIAPSPSKSALAGLLDPPRGRVMINRPAPTKFREVPPLGGSSKLVRTNLLGEGVDALT